MSLQSEITTSGVSFRIVHEFGAALERGERPSIADHLPLPDDGAVLIRLLHLEMAYKLKNGVESSAAECIARFPRIAGDQAAVADLIEAEFALRRRGDPSLDRAGFLARYPEFAADLTTAFTTCPPAGGGPGRRGPSDAKLRAIVASRYTLTERLGQGGMGEVWVAEQSEPVGRRVAIKLIKPGMDSRTVVQRFEQERQALALMDHPNIARVLDGGLTEDHRSFFVMELIDGPPLSRFCDEARLDVRARLELFVPICQAVQHAHQKGVVHRDLKPSNILVTMTDGRPVPKVIDFGVAKATGGAGAEESVATQFGAVVGTLEYMSPEQAGLAGADVDTRADIYSLGAVLYELLTGLRPFEAIRMRAAAFDQVLRMIREEEPPRPSARLAGDPAAAALAAARRTEPARLAGLLRGELDWIVMRCLEKHRERRYATANDLARDLRHFLADEAVEARPPSVGYRLRKFATRNRRPVLAAALLAVAVLAGAAGTTWGLIRAERAKAQAEIDRRAAAQKEETAAQLTDYLVRTFESADPVGIEFAGFHASGDRPEEATARKILERGAEVVREHLHDQPLARASLLHAIGNSYRNLGDWEAARSRIAEAHDLRRHHLGDDHADTVVSLQSLAHLARDRGDYAEADRLYRDAIARREKLFGADHLLVAQSKAYLAWMTFYRPLSVEGPQFDQGRLGEAERILLEVLEVREAKLPENHRDIGLTLAALASVKLGQPGQEFFAIGYASRAAEVFRRCDQGTPLANVVVELTRAEQHRKAGRYDEAETGYLKVLGVCRRHLGDRHPLVMLQMGNLAGLYRKKGDMAGAEKAAEEFLQRVRLMPALRSQPIVVDGLTQYADQIRERRGKSEAEVLYREVLRFARERSGGNENNIAAIEKRLVEVGRDPK